MARVLILLSCVIVLGGCKKDLDKYELKSPCVAVESGNDPAPCVRRPVNGHIG